MGNNVGNEGRERNTEEEKRSCKEREAGKNRRALSYIDEAERESGSSLPVDKILVEEPDPGYETETSPEKKYSVDDYYAFKDDIRRELIDGRFFVMEAPSVTHQALLGELFSLFRECIRLHGRDCRVLFAPCDVQLDRDKYTMVQPDLFVVCGKEKIHGRSIYGAPDLVAEIMSPSSRSRDSVLKLNKYAKAGVCEYWIVDPENRRVLVYLFDRGGEGAFHQYSFTDRIPIHLSGGECEVDFSVVNRAIEGLDEWEPYL